MLSSAIYLSFAHVRMLYLDGQPGPIRAATSATGDGRRSVSGACGLGNPAFGANGVGTLIDSGTVQLTLRQTYAAGHTGNQQKFRMAFTCGDTSAQGVAAAPALTAAANGCTATRAGTASAYLDTGTIGVDASTGPANNPYEVTCTIPSQGLTSGQTQQCTIALIAEGGHGPWGDCVDVNLVSAAASLPPSTPPLPPVSNRGTYQLTAAGRVDTSASTFTCCTLSGTLEIGAYTMGTAVVTGGLNAVAEGCRTSAAIGAPPTASHTVRANVLLSNAGQSSSSKYASPVDQPVLIGGQPFLFEVDSQQLSFTMSNAQLQPIVCDGFSNFEMQALNTGGAATGGGSGGAIVGALFGVAALGGAMYLYRSRKTTAATAQQGAMMNYSKAQQAMMVAHTPPPPPGGPALPPGWTASTDPASGHVYYYNTFTRVTQWEFPGAPPGAPPPPPPNQA